MTSLNGFDDVVEKAMSIGERTGPLKFEAFEMCLSR